MHLTAVLFSKFIGKNGAKIRGTPGRLYIGANKRQRSISVPQWRNWEKRKEIEACTRALLERPPYLTALEDRIPDGHTLYGRNLVKESALRKMEKEHTLLRNKLGHLNPYKRTPGFC